MLDTKRLADTLVSGAKAYIDKALAGITSRIDALEKRLPEKGEKGDRGERGDAGKDGQNGVGLAAALIDKNGELVVTLSDGGVQKLGVVVGADGKDGEKGERGEKGEAGERGADGADGRDGKDGVDAVEFFKSDAGHLIVTMSNGATRDLGPIVGKDGAPGRDGFSLKDFDAELMPDGRSILLKFADETDTSFAVELGIPTMIYRGAYKHDQTYSRGDTVTWNGSLWHCNVDGNGDRPGDRDSGWSLAAKAGRDGKDYSPQEPKAHEPVRLK
ncbi:hypothetical protein [Aquamicrobium lusatiense]|uniref:hypothetical protein n=1 Tax=Aquamicrobium lusatiense TaxID=89772 RepID=UPI001AEE57A3|nr:hypothetical protein [Aquamicrobium lusatiense]